MTDSLQQRLAERVKELTALHEASRLFQDAARPLPAVMTEVVALLGPAWQYPDIAEGRITLGTDSWQTPGWCETPWTQCEEFTLRDGSAGALAVAYREERPEADEGPFLREERALIRSLSEMLRIYLQHRRDDDAILRTNERLEREVAARTVDLRRLASQLCVTEERERRAIAEDLHDHLGQALAFIRARLRQLQGDAVFGGHGSQVSELLALTDQAIRYTRNLTFELSPPVLYELGLGPALEWLGEQFAGKHGLRVRVRSDECCDLAEELVLALFKSARELLTNVAKHAHARTVEVELAHTRGQVVLSVSDDGCGCDPSTARQRGAGRTFGLFSIEERIGQLGGALELASTPDGGLTARVSAPRVAEVQP